MTSRPAAVFRSLMIEYSLLESFCTTHDQALWNGEDKNGLFGSNMSPGRTFVYCLYKATGSLSGQSGSAYALSFVFQISLGFEPVRVFVCLSWAYTRYSTPSSSASSCMSPQRGS